MSIVFEFDDHLHEMDQEAFFGLAEGERPADRERGAKLLRIARDVQDVASIMERAGKTVNIAEVIAHVERIRGGALDADTLAMASFILDRAMKRQAGELPTVDDVYRAADIQDAARFYGAVFKSE